MNAPSENPPASGRPAPAPPIDGKEFRNVMRKLAGAVAIISTEGEGAMHGFTATAVCSVCAEPPTILIVVNRSARTHPHISQKGVFAVNILAEDQSELATQFASKAQKHFADIAHAVTLTGVPILTEAAAFIECSIVNQIEVGTHTIFIGRVIGAGATTSTPLIYHDAQYARPAAI